MRPYILNLSNRNYMSEQPWWYLKKLRNPAGVRGRPKSKVPVAERRKLARQEYQARLTVRGLRLVRLFLPEADAVRLHNLALQHGASTGQIVAKLLGTNGAADSQGTASAMTTRKP